MDTEQAPSSNLMRKFLKKFLNKEVLIFIFFLFVSCAFWLTTVLNDTMEREIDVPIHLTGVPNGVIMTSNTTDTVRVMVRDKGFTIANYIYGDGVPTLEIGYSMLHISDDNASMTNTELQKNITRVLSASSRIVQMKPDRLVFYFNHGKSKKVPVVLNGSVTAAESYFLEPISFMPDSVMIYAPDGILSKIKEVRTIHTEITDVNAAQMHKIRLAPPEGVRCVPEVVSMNLNAVILTEGIVNVPIKAVNMPEGMTLRTFPARVQIKYVVASSRYQDITEDQFAVEADYRYIEENPESKKCPLVLRVVPRHALRPQLEFTEVDYLIEK